MPKILPEVDEALRECAPSLRCPAGVDGLQLLRALCIVESSGGSNNMPRAELAYSPGGRYFRRSAALRVAYARYGAAVCCSWGPLQVMYLTALEQGYEGAPWLLADPNMGVRAAVSYLNRRVFPQASQLVDIADAYNSGSCRDTIVPEAYCRKLIAAYMESEDGP